MSNDHVKPSTCPKCGSNDKRVYRKPCDDGTMSKIEATQTQKEKEGKAYEKAKRVQALPRNRKCFERACSHKVFLLPGYWKGIACSGFSFPRLAVAQAPIWRRGSAQKPATFTRWFSFLLILGWSGKKLWFLLIACVASGV